ncbi:O-antigen ligase family protein [Cetobacterium sp.]|uniref:O-antigen ligase family protein n=1 Tax=Cetobacterium sp. TaxID=2071632 RepID=UPI003EE522F9
MKKIDYAIIEESVIKILMFLMPMATLGIRKLQFNILIPLLIILSIIQIYKKGFKVSFYEKYLLIFIISILISLGFTDYPIKLGLKAGKSFLCVLILPTLFGQFKIKENYFKYGLISMILGSLILYKSFLEEIQNILKVHFGIIEPIYKTLSYKNIMLLQKLGTGYRLSGDFRYIALTASILGMIILVVFTVIFEKNVGKIFKSCLGIFLIPTIYFFLLTQSRAGYLSLIIVVILYLIYIFKNRILYILLTIFVSCLGLINIFTDNPYVVRAKNIFKFDASNLARLEVYKESLRLFKTNFITGVGYENFILAQDKTKYKFTEFYYHSHNMGLKLLSELGILGFISYYLWMFQILKNIFLEKEKLIKRVTFLVILNYLIFENFEILVINRAVYSVLFLILAFGINSNYKEIKGARK